MFKYLKPYTHLQLYDKTGYFNSILSSSFLSAVDPSCKSTDLQIICQLEEGVHVPLDVQSAVLCSQSDFILNLVKVGGEQPVLMLPEVEINTVQRLLELLYHGVCYFSLEYERFKLLRLLSLLRMDNVIKNLQVNQVFKPKDVNLNDMVEVGQDQPQEEEQKECKICKKKFQGRKKVELVLHETECAKKKAEKSPSRLESQKKRRRISAGSEQAEKLTKRCPICHHDIAAAGKGWRYPFYSHLARRHFSSQLLRDYISSDLKCLVCGKDGQSFSGPSKQGQLIAHLGGKHRLIEKYMDLDEKGDLVVKKTKKLKKTPGVAAKSDGKVKEREEAEAEQGRVKRKRVLPLRYQEKTSEDGSRPSQKPASPPGSLGEIPCRYCDQKFMKQAVVQSHLLSTHFRKDCEQAIRQILQRTGGKCPLCPKESWSDYSKLDWSMFLHFSRKHKIAENCLFNEDVMRQENVDSMVRKFFPNE